MKAWKQFEADAAELFHGARFWANSGERVDFSGRVRNAGCICTSTGSRLDGIAVRGQCKLTKRLSLEALTRLTEEAGVDVVCVKVRRGAGRRSPGLVVMTFETYAKLHG